MQSGYNVSPIESDGMVEIRVTIDEKFNKILDKVVESGFYLSKSELMRSATVYLLIQIGVLKEIIEK